MKITRTQFRVLVAASFLLLMMSVIAGMTGQNTLPPELQNYLQNQYGESQLSTEEYTHFIISLIAIISFIGIFFFVKWARKFFTVSYILSCVGMAFLGPSVKTGLETALVELSIFSAGVIVACMYLTELRTEFET